MGPPDPTPGTPSSWGLQEGWGGINPWGFPPRCPRLEMRRMLGVCGEAEGWCPLSLSLVFALWLLPPRWRVAAVGLGGWERKTFLSAFCFPLSQRTSLSKENITVSPVRPHLRVGDKPDAGLGLAHMGAPSHGHWRPRGHSAPHWDASTGQEGVRRSQACSTCDSHRGGCVCPPPKAPSRISAVSHF